MRLSKTEQLRRRGFDRSRVVPFRGVRAGCSQCQAIAINGIAVHEEGCPNELVTIECFECGFRYDAPKSEGPWGTSTCIRNGAHYTREVGTCPGCREDQEDR